MSEPTHLGTRVAQARRQQGWTQHQLARATGFSISLVQHVEQGTRPASHAFASASARALGSDIRWLVGQVQVHRQHVASDAAPALRHAMDSWDDPGVDGPARPLPELRVALNKAESLRHRGRYDTIAVDLPDVLRHLYVHAAEASPGTQASEWTQECLADAYSLMQSAANRYGAVDLVGQAVDRHVIAADRSGDPLRPAVAAYRRSNQQMRWGAYDRALRSLQRAVDAIADQATPAADAIRVQLALRQGVIAARSGDRARADELVTDARTRVRSGHLPPHPYFNVISTVSNADMHWMAVAMEAQDGTSAVERARGVELPVADAPRVSHWWIDLARAWLLHGDRARSLDAIDRARVASSQHAQYNPSVHETLATIAAQDSRSRSSGQLSRLLRWTGVAPA